MGSNPAGGGMSGRDIGDRNDGLGQPVAEGTGMDMDDRPLQCCANCQKSDHWLSTCKGPLTREGCLRGCPWCNSTSHSWDMCQKRIRNRLNDFNYEVTNRAGRAPLEMKEDWREKHQVMIQAQTARLNNRVPWSKDTASQNRMMPHRYMADHTMEEYVLDKDVMVAEKHQGSQYSVEQPGDPVAPAFQIPPPEPDRFSGMVGHQDLRSDTGPENERLAMIGLMSTLVKAVVEPRGFGHTSLPSIPEDRVVPSAENSGHIDRGHGHGLAHRSKAHTTQKGLKATGGQLHKNLLNSRQQGVSPISLVGTAYDWSSDAAAPNGQVARLRTPLIVTNARGVIPSCLGNRKRSAGAAKFPHNREDGEAPLDGDDSDSSETAGGDGSRRMPYHRSKRSKNTREGRIQASSSIRQSSLRNISGMGESHAGSKDGKARGKGVGARTQRDARGVGFESDMPEAPRRTSFDSDMPEQSRDGKRRKQLPIGYIEGGPIDSRFTRPGDEPLKN